MTKALSILAALLLLSACGSSGDQKEAAENIGAGIAGSDTPISDEDASCFSEKLVDVVGIEKLKEYGVIGDDLSYGEDLGSTAMEEADAEAAADAFVDCVDIESQLAELASEQGDQLECITDKLDDTTYRALMKATFMLDQAAMASALEPIQECQLTGLPGETP